MPSFSCIGWIQILAPEGLYFVQHLKKHMSLNQFLCCYQEMADLIANSTGLSASELAQRKEELKQRHKIQLSDFDNLTNELVNKAEKILLPRLDIEETNARLSLKEKQLKDLAEAMRTLNPVEALAHQYEEDAKKAEEEARRYREETLRKMNEELERQKREMTDKEEEKKRKMAEQLS